MRSKLRLQDARGQGHCSECRLLFPGDRFILEQYCMILLVLVLLEDENHTLCLVDDWMLKLAWRYPFVPPTCAKHVGGTNGQRCWQSNCSAETLYRCQRQAYLARQPPVLQGANPKKVWDPLSVAYSILLGQEPKTIGHFQNVQWTSLLQEGPVVKLQRTSSCNPVTLCRDLCRENGSPVLIFNCMACT